MRSVWLAPCLLGLLLPGCSEPTDEGGQGQVFDADPEAVMPQWKSWNARFTTDLSNRAQVGGVDAPTHRLNDTDTCAVIEAKELTLKRMEVAANWSTDQRLRVVQFLKEDSGGPEFFVHQNGPSPIAAIQEFEPTVRRDNVYAALTVANDTVASIGMQEVAEVRVTLLVSGDGLPRFLGMFNCEYMFPGFPN